MSIITTNWLMVPSEIIAVYSECNKEPANALCGIIHFLTLTAVCTCNCSSSRDLSGHLEQAQSRICVSQIGETRNMCGLYVLKYIEIWPLRTTEWQ